MGMLLRRHREAAERAQREAREAAKRAAAERLRIAQERAKAEAKPKAEPKPPVEKVAAAPIQPVPTAIEDTDLEELERLTRPDDKPRQGRSRSR